MGVIEVSGFGGAGVFLGSVLLRRDKVCICW